MDNRDVDKSFELRCDLSSAALPLGDFARGNSAALTEVLASIHAQYVLVVDELIAPLLNLSGPISSLIPTDCRRVAQLHDPVDQASLVGLEIQEVVFLLGTTMRAASRAVAVFQSYITLMQRPVHSTMAFVPEPTAAVSYMLSQKYLKSDVNVVGVPLHNVPLDTDIVYSNYDPHFLQRTLVDSDTLVTKSSAHALVQFQKTVGPLAAVLALGPQAIAVADMAHDLLLQETGLNEDTLCTIAQPTVLGGLILDRQMDTVTPLLRQLTLQGVLADHYFVTPELKLCDLVDHNESHETMLHSNNPFFVDTRDVYVAAIGDSFNQLTTQMRQDQDISQLRQEDVQTLYSYFGSQLAEQINRKRNGPLMVNVFADLDFFSVQNRAVMRNMISVVQGSKAAGQAVLTQAMSVFDELYSSPMASELLDIVMPESERDLKTTRQFWRAMADICLVSQLTHPLRAKEFQQLVDSVFQACGIEHVTTIERLNQVRLLLNENTSKMRGVKRMSFQELLRALGAFVDNQTSEQTDAAYTFGGYCPLLVRVYERFIAALNDPREGLHGRLTALTMELDKMFGEHASKLLFNPSVEAQAQAHVAATSTMNTAVYALGGLSFGEVSGLRCAVSKHTDSDRYLTLTALTTSLLTSTSFLSQFAGETCVADQPMIEAALENESEPEPQPDQSEGKEKRPFGKRRNKK